MDSPKKILWQSWEVLEDNPDVISKANAGRIPEGTMLGSCVRTPGIFLVGINLEEFGKELMVEF